jgi:serine/threonine protein phosphatase PrpC
VQQGAAFWAHVGDSRVYHIRDGKVLERTRDHSHVEQLLREGEITEAEVAGHPMRNFVECCLGGEVALPEMTVNTRRPLKRNDILLLCTDGVWSNLRDSDIASFFSADGLMEGKDLRATLAALGNRAVKVSAPYSDNTTAAALRFLET